MGRIKTRQKKVDSAKFWQTQKKNKLLSDLKQEK